MSYSDLSAHQLVGNVVSESQPAQAWKSAIRLSMLDCSGVVQTLKMGLYSTDLNVRECCLEVLVSRRDPLVTVELRHLFQGYAPTLTGNIASVARLRTSSVVDAMYSDLDQRLREDPKASILGDPLELIDMIPRIQFPRDSRLHASQVILQMYANPNFFRDLTENDIKRLHAIFYRDYDNEEYTQYRTRRLWAIKNIGRTGVKAWSFEGLRDTTTESSNRHLVGPASIPLVTSSLIDKLHDANQDHSIQFIGEVFYHFNCVHPFEEYNGRTNWILLNLFLLHSGLPFVRIENMDVYKYFQTLNATTPTEFVNFLGDLLSRQVK